MTILDTLKKLHKKMTGQDTNEKTIGKVLGSLEENYTGTTGGDNSETVTSNIYQVHVTEDNLTMTITETAGEVYQAAQDGKLIFMSGYVMGGYTTCPMLHIQYHEESEIKYEGYIIIPMGEDSVALGFKATTENDHLSCTLNF